MPAWSRCRIRSRARGLQGDPVVQRARAEHYDNRSREDRGRDEPPPVDRGEEYGADRTGDDEAGQMEHPAQRPAERARAVSDNDTLLPAGHGDLLQDPGVRRLRLDPARCGDLGSQQPAGLSEVLVCDRPS